MERPISEAARNGAAGLAAFVAQDDGKRIFLWLALIFLKTHVKDMYLPDSRDRRSPSGRIGDAYSWEELHHVHAVVRAAMTGCAIQDEVLGSRMIIQVSDNSIDNSFDYNGQFASKTVMIRLGDTAFIAVLNDSGGSINALRNIIKNLPSDGVTFVHLAELLTEFQLVNLHIKDRPIYRTEIDISTGMASIKADIPSELALVAVNFELRGSLMIRNLSTMIHNIKIPGLDREGLEEEIRRGRVSFIQ